MTMQLQYHMCRVKHDPERGTYGDCLRASVASILGIPRVEDVPHFLEDGCSDGTEVMRRVREWGALIGYLPFAWFVEASASDPPDDVLAYMAANFPGVTYMLFGATSNTDHVVICQDARVVHDTAWMRSRICRPASNGNYGVMVWTPKVAL